MARAAPVNLADQLGMDGEALGGRVELVVEGQQDVHPDPGRRLVRALRLERVLPPIERGLGMRLAHGSLRG